MLFSSKKNDKNLTTFIWGTAVPQCSILSSETKGSILGLNKENQLQINSLFNNITKQFV